MQKNEQTGPKSNLYELAKKYIAAGPKVDSTEIIRRMRDENWDENEENVYKQSRI